MGPEEVKATIRNAFPECQVNVEERHGQYQVNVIGNLFEELNPVQRQQKIYAPLSEYITQGRLHAVNVKGWTEEEWQEQLKEKNGNINS